MYYPSYEDYMRDLFYFNGLSNPNNSYLYSGLNMNNQNLNDYYPSIYKIINPVVQKVVSGNNYQFVNEETINNIVDVVLGITIGDIENLENTQRNDTKRQCNNSCNSQNNSTSCNSSNNSVNTTINQYQDNVLLKDLIRILTIKEISNRNNIRRFPNAYNNNIQPQPYYMNSPYMMY